MVLTPNKTRKRITEELVHTKFLESNKRSATSFISAKRDNDNKIIYQIITGVQNASRHISGLLVGVIRFPINGIRTQVFAENRSRNYAIRNEPEELIVVTYYHLVNRVTKF